MELANLIAIVVGVISLGACFTATIGDAKVITAALEGMSRQPEIQGKLFTSMLTGVGLLESIPIISIVIAFMLIPLISK